MRVITAEEYFKKKKKGENIFDDDIAPVRSDNGVIDIRDLIETSGMDIKDFSKHVNTIDELHQQQKDQRKWLDFGAFEDGFDLMDIPKTIGGTALNVGVNLARGSAMAGEKLVELGAGGVAQVSDWLGNDELAENIRGKLAGKNEAYNKWTDKYLLSNNFNKMSNALDSASITGEKFDDLTASVGQLLAGASLGNVGANLVMFGSSAGGELSNAYKNGATDGQAWFSAVVSGASEVLFEKLSGGIKFGGSTLDDFLPINALTDKIANKTVQTLTKLGIDAVGEGFEEVLTEVASNVGRKLSYEDEQTWKEILASDEALDSYLEAFIGGGLMGGGFNTGKAINSIKTGRNYTTGLTTNEQLVLDKEIEARIKEASKDNKKLSNKEINKIKEEAKMDLQKGNISTGTIESTLGGETYKNLQNQKSEVESIKKEIKKLESKKMSEMSVGEYNSSTAQIKALQERIGKIDTKTLEEQLNSEMEELTGSDDYLKRSYYEKAQREVEFEADLSKYDAKQQEIIKKAIDSKVLNNSTKTHEFVDMVAKLSADKGVSFDFTNNKKLKGTSFAIEGKRVNGFVTKDGQITINVDSNKALNSVVGHEITHVLEGTELYTELQQAVKNYSMTKGDYNARLKALQETYEGIEGANIENELTADLIGDYLFTDTDFVRQLSTEKPNLFQKIYNEIKYLVKIATAGSKEARELEKVKKAFEDAYREGATQSDTQTPATKQVSKQVTKETKLSLTDNQSRELSKEQQDFFKDSKVRDENGNLLTVYHGTRGDFNVFDKTKAGDNYENGWSQSGKGFYFTDNKAEAQEFGDYSLGDADTQIKEVYLNITNPFDTSVEDATLLAKIGKEYGADAQALQRGDYLLRWFRNNGIDGTEALKKYGYDGIIDYGHYVAFDSNQIKNVDNAKPTASEDIRYSLSEKTIQGLERYSPDEIKQLTKEYIQEKLYEADLYDVVINGIAIHGSRARGTARADSDLDIVVEYEGDVREDTLFDILNEEPMYFNDIQVDINPITAYKTGTLEEYMESSNAYDQEVLAKQNTKYSLSDNQGRELSEGQREYFKDSKVRDENGNLLAVYHGSVSEDRINVFDTKIAPVRPRTGADGTYFTSDQRTAGSYRGRKGTMYAVYLNIENPLNITEDIKKYRKSGLTFGEAKRKALEKLNDTHDGVIFDGDRYNSDEYTVFNSNQIKNINNLNPTDSPDIRYSITDNKGRELSESQREYFKDSKIRDKDGNLLTIYHGTKNDFSVFSENKIGTSTDIGIFGKGFYFSNQKNVADGYKPNGSGETKEVYLNLKNPFVWNEIRTKEQLEDFIKETNMPDGVAEWNNGRTPFAIHPFSDSNKSKIFTDTLIKNGYDGIVFEYEGGMADIFGNDTKEIVAFNSNQIKNVDNTNPTDDADIRYSLSEEEKAQIRYDRLYGVESDKELAKERRKINKEYPGYFSENTDDFGYEITPEQKEYFKDTKAKGINNSLTTVFHTMTSPNVQFNEFNPVGTPGYRFGKQIVNFFTDSYIMSSSYADDDYSMADTSKFNNLDEVNAWLESENDELATYKADFSDGKATLQRNINGTWTTYQNFKSLDDLLKNVQKYAHTITDRYQYVGYLNITNPFVVDAEGREWDMVRPFEGQKIETYNSFTDAQKDALRKVVKNKSEFKFLEALGDSSAYVKWGMVGIKYQKFNGSYLTDAEINILADIYENDDISHSTIYEIVKSDFDKNVIDKYSTKYQTTNDVVFDVLEMNKNGSNYDGIIIKNVRDYGGFVEGKRDPNNVYVTFASNQFKARNNTNPTDDADIRYSLSEKGTLQDSNGNEVTLQASDTGTHGTLMAIHNLNEGKLKGVIELGGFPVPSIAVTNNYTSNANFGEISVLFDKNTIDPELNEANKVYSRDAYTTRIPNIANKINESGLQQVSENTGLETWDLKDRFRETTLENAVEDIKRNENILDRYLEQKGIEVEPIYRDFRGLTSLSQRALQRFINEHQDLLNMDYTDRMSFSTYEKYYKDVHDLFVDEAVEKTNGKATREQAEALYREYPGFNHWDYFLRDLTAVQELEGSQQLDEYATKDAKEKAVDINSKEYNDFVRDLISPMFGDKYVRNNKDYYTASGNPRSFDQRYEAFTLENIVKIMNENKGTGQEGGFFTGIGELAGDSSKRFTSIEDIKNNEHLLETQNREEYQAVLDKYSEEMRDINSDILQQYGDLDTDSYIWKDKSISETMKSIARKVADGKKVNIKSVISQFDKNYIKVNEEQAQRTLDLINNIANLPTDYFEAKPQRAVGLDEVQAIVIPNTTSAEFKQQLQDAGLKYYEYDPNIEGDRQRVINQFDDLKFSLSNKNDIAPVKDSNLTYGEDVRIEQAIAPIQDEIATLTESINKLAEQIAPVQDASETTVTEEIAPVGNEPMLPADNPQRGDGDIKQRKWVETSTESDVVNRQILPDDLDEKQIYYQVKTNAKTLETANNKLGTLGYEKSVEYFNNQLMNKRASVEDIALGERLIQEAIKKGDKVTASELIQNVAILGTELGQKVQALSIIKRMTPEGQLRMLDKTIQRAKAKEDEVFKNVKLTQEMKNKILDVYAKDGSYDQDELNRVIEEIKQELADQMPTTTMEKVNAWRYLSMLGNPKTHIRNLVSNVAMKGTLAVKNAMARTIESIAPIKDRTKTWKKTSDVVNKFADDVTLEMKDIINGDSKYNEEADIKAKRDTFKNKVLNGVYNFNSNLLEAEDWWFSKSAFKNSFAEYLTANGIETEADIESNPEIIEKAKNYALEQSQIATFRQYSWLANKIRDIESKNVATQVAVGSIIPFKKTPINIAKAGLSYSPLGFAKTLTYDIVQVKKGKMEASTLIDHLAQNTTGTALTLIGYMLASAGFLNGGGEDDKEGKYDYQLGEQAYSITIGGNTYSLSWLSPVAMPLFVGANAYEQLVEGKELDGNVIVETLAQTLDPLSEMSFLSGLDQVLSSYDSGMEKFAGIFESMGQNYITQFIPTLSSQVASTLDDTKRSTKASGDSGFKFGEETYNKIAYKIPGLRNTLEPSTDIWGNEVKQNENIVGRAFDNFLAPYSRREIITSDIDYELKDLYAETGENGLLPNVPNNYVNYKNEKYKMSAEEHTQYKKTYGQTAYDLLEDLFETTTYQNAEIEDKVDMVEKVYDYARDTAKKEYLESRDVEYTNATKDKQDYYKENSIKEAIKNDVSIDEMNYAVKNPSNYAVISQIDSYENYLEYKKSIDDIKDMYKSVDGMTSKQKTALSNQRKRAVQDYIESLNLGVPQKIMLQKMAGGYSVSSYKNYMYQYIESLPLSAEEKRTIHNELFD